jgi:hypothetical protein
MSADSMDSYMIAVSAIVVDGNIQVAGEAHNCARNLRSSSD